MAQKVEQSRGFPWAITAFILIIVIAAAVVFYRYTQSLQFVESEIATLSVDQVTISSPQTGKLTDWKVETGSKVSKNDQLGTEEFIPTQVASSQTSPSQQSGTATSQQIQAPIDGTVIQTNLKTGQTVTQGQPLAVIADLSKVYVEAYVDEDDVKDVSVGKDVDITFDAYPNQTFSGKVDQVGRSAGKFVQGSNSVATSESDKKEVQRVPVRITLDDFSVDRPVIGLNATVKIHK